jgi:hypothetical protein
MPWLSPPLEKDKGDILSCPRLAFTKTPNPLLFLKSGRLLLEVYRVNEKDPTRETIRNTTARVDEAKLVLTRFFFEGRLGIRKWSCAALDLETWWIVRGVSRRTCRSPSNKPAFRCDAWLSSSVYLELNQPILTRY